jgi:DNA-directed RNA polymerase subunit RPC12/RpoP
MGPPEPWWRLRRACTLRLRSHSLYECARCGHELWPAEHRDLVEARERAQAVRTTGCMHDTYRPTVDSAGLDLFECAHCGHELSPVRLERMCAQG